jgi:hypothetical protein
MKYLNWKEEKILDDSPESINRMYDNGFVFTRIDKGVMQQTRSVRIDLNRFDLYSFHPGDYENSGWIKNASFKNDVTHWMPLPEPPKL